MMEDLRHWALALTIEAKWVCVSGSYYGYRDRSASTVKTPSVGYFRSVFEMPMDVYQILERELSFTHQELKMFWNQCRAGYIYHIRFLSNNWEKLTDVDQQQVIVFYRKFHHFFDKNPVDFLSRLQMLFLSRGWGNRTNKLYQYLEVVLNRYIRGGKQKS